jgi:hypothetical protein
MIIKKNTDKNNENQLPGQKLMKKHRKQMNDKEFSHEKK